MEYKLLELNKANEIYTIYSYVILVIDKDCSPEKVRVFAY